MFPTSSTSTKNKVANVALQEELLDLSINEEEGEIYKTAIKHFGYRQKSWAVGN